MQLAEDWHLQELLAGDPNLDGDVLDFLLEWGQLTVDLGERQDPLEALPEVGDRLLPRTRHPAKPRAAREAALADPSTRWIDLERHCWRVLRAVSRHLLAASRGGDVLDAWEEEDVRVADAADAWRLFGSCMNAGLQGFPMYVKVDGSRVAASSVEPSTYEVGVLQIARAASAGKPVRICANVKCAKPFTAQRTSRRQYAGTEHTQDVKYCSRQCAQAQAARDRRARRKQMEAADR